MVVWKGNKKSPEEYDAFPGGFNSPSDLVSDGGMEFLIVDPWYDKILRFNHLYQSLPTVAPVMEDQKLEPLSVCRVRDGSLMVINKADEDVWQIKQNRKAFAMGWSQAPGGQLDRPFSIDYAKTQNRILILDAQGLKISSPFSLSVKRIGLNIEDPVGMGISGDEAWIVGDGIAAVSLNGEREVFHMPADSLKTWSVFPAVDVAVSSDGNLLYVLSESGGRVLVMRIFRDTGGSSE